LVAWHAGSERNKLSGATGEHFKEAYSINMKCRTMFKSASCWAILCDRWLIVMQAVSATSCQGNRRNTSSKPATSA